MCTTRAERLALEFAMCFDALDKLAPLWETNSPEDCRELVQNLFESIVCHRDLL